MKTKKRQPSSALAEEGQSHKSGKWRIDTLLLERGLVPSRERAQALLLAGQVLANGQRIEKPGTRVLEDAKIQIVGQTPRYASRGGLKLEGALNDFSVNAAGRICLDIGSSTGGFTDCLLQNGAHKVYAVDVTTAQLDWKLRQDPRVIPVERNARYLRREDIGESPSLVTLDVSFISVAKVLPAIVPIAAPGADFLILIKPQFELEKRDVGKGGIVREASLHQKAVERGVAAGAQLGLEIAGLRPSRLPGAEGNREFFLHAKRPA